MSSSSPVRWWPFEGYGLALVTLGSFLALTILTRLFYPFLPFFLVAALTVGTVASTRPFPRLEAQLSRWLLAVAFVVMAVVTVSTLPEEVDPNDGPRCYGNPLCPELKEWWDGHLRDRGQHERGIAVLGWWSFVAAGVLVARFWQVLVASSPLSPPIQGGRDLLREGWLAPPPQHRDPGLERAGPVGALVGSRLGDARVVRRAMSGTPCLMI